MKTSVSGRELWLAFHTMHELIATRSLGALFNRGAERITAHTTWRQSRDAHSCSSKQHGNAHKICKL